MGMPAPNVQLLIIANKVSRHAVSSIYATAYNHQQRIAFIAAEDQLSHQLMASALLSFIEDHQMLQ